jgi:hypothetical protein
MVVSAAVRGTRGTTECDGEILERKLKKFRDLLTGYKITAPF